MTQNRAHRELFARAEQCACILSRQPARTWAAWRTIAVALALAQSQAMAQAHATTPHGPAYRKLMARFFSEYPALSAIAPTQRSAACRLAARLKEVDAWRDGLPQRQRDKLNDPRRVLSKFLAHEHAIAETRREAGPTASPIEQLRLEVAALAARVAVLELEAAERREIPVAPPLLIAAE